MIEQLRKDPALKLNLGTVLLTEGRTDEAITTFRELLAANPGPEASREAGTTLLRFDQYSLAKDFLERDPNARLDLAIALFFTEGKDAALKALEQIPGGRDTGDAQLLKAVILDNPEAISTRQAISRPRLAEQAALLLVHHKQGEKALELLRQALQSTPDDAGLMLTKVVALTSAGRNGEALKAVKEIETRWPEWDRPYLVDGLIIERESHLTEARQRIQIALALGSQDPAAQCALTRMASKASNCACQPGLYESFFPDCLPPTAK
jgi:tetratricopeptide (TPR) repeat protein